MWLWDLRSLQALWEILTRVAPGLVLSSTVLGVRLLIVGEINVNLAETLAGWLLREGTGMVAWKPVGAL